MQNFSSKETTNPRDYTDFCNALSTVWKRRRISVLSRWKLCTRERSGRYLEGRQSERTLKTVAVVHFCTTTLLPGAWPPLCTLRFHSFQWQWWYCWVEDRRSIPVELKRGKHIRELRYGSCVLIKVHFLLKMPLGFKNAGAQGFWIFDILDTCKNSMWYRFDYQPQFGKGARAPPRKHSGRVDQTRESGGNGA